MPYDFYKVFHVFGIMMLFLGLGGSLLPKESARRHLRTLFVVFHGLGLLFILVSGFGMLARTQEGMSTIPAWIHPKILIWVLLGAMAAGLKRLPQKGGILSALSLLLGLTAVILAVNKPF